MDARRRAAATAKIRARFLRLRSSLSERARRLFVADEAIACGSGGIAAAARATGMAPSVIGRGIAEVRAIEAGTAPPLDPRRSRRPLQPAGQSEAPRRRAASGSERWAALGATGLRVDYDLGMVVDCRLEAAADCRPRAVAAVTVDDGSVAPGAPDRRRDSAGSWARRPGVPSWRRR
jgi:hypothetical protein